MQQYDIATAIHQLNKHGLLAEQEIKNGTLWIIGGKSKQDDYPLPGLYVPGIYLDAFSIVQTESSWLAKTSAFMPYTFEVQCQTLNDTVDAICSLYFKIPNVQIGDTQYVVTRFSAIGAHVEIDVPAKGAIYGGFGQKLNNNYPRNFTIVTRGKLFVGQAADASKGSADWAKMYVRWTLPDLVDALIDHYQNVSA